MEAKQLLREDTVEYYYVADDQYTIKGDYPNILNETGLGIFNDILNKIKREEFKGTFTKTTLIPYRSGIWHRNLEHIAHKMDNNTHRTVLCTWNNCKLVGILNGKETTTNILQFYTPWWVYTLSGNLYKIK